MQTRFKDRVRFVQLDWNSEQGRQAAARAGMENPPISLLLDSNGAVAHKFEGAQSTESVGKKLEELVSTCVQK